MTAVTRNYLVGAAAAAAGCAHVFGLISAAAALVVLLPAAVGLLGCAVESFFCGVDL